MSQNPRMMRAAVLDRFGSADRLALSEVEVPEVGSHDVLIRVQAAGTGSWDAQEREGHYEGVFGLEARFPYILGWDGAGVVAAVGADVTRVKVGERVFAASMPLPRGGFYAEFAIVNENHVAAIPPDLPFEAAAALPWDALTALSGLDTLDLQAGETLMIFGASGGIGHIAVQLAKRIGARVLAVASGADGVALSLQLGANAAIDGRREDVLRAAKAFAPAGIDAALVTVGGEAADRALAALRVGGRAASPFGVQPEPQAPAGTELRMYDGDRSAIAMDRMKALVASGAITAHLAEVYPFEAVAEAHKRLESHYVGKLALRIQGISKDDT